MAIGKIHELTEGSKWFTARLLRMAIANCEEKMRWWGKSAPYPVRKRMARWFGWEVAARCCATLGSGVGLSRTKEGEILVIDPERFWVWGLRSSSW